MAEVILTSGFWKRFISSSQGDSVTSGVGVTGSGVSDGAGGSIVPVGLGADGPGVPCGAGGSVGLVRTVGAVGLAGPAQAAVNSRDTKSKAKQTLPINTDRLFLFTSKPLIRFLLPKLLFYIVKTEPINLFITAAMNPI